MTTIGLLAQAITSEAEFDTSRYGDRSSFVDALLVLGQWGVVRATAGTVDAFLEDERGNAILAADTARLHRLAGQLQCPQRLRATRPTRSKPPALLLAEPRYGEAPRDPGTVSDEQRLLWTRHSLARRVFDDPVALLEDLSPAEQDYLTPSVGSAMAARPGGRGRIRAGGTGRGGASPSIPMPSPPICSSPPRRATPTSWPCC